MSRLNLIDMFKDESIETFNKCSKAYELGRSDERTKVLKCIESHLCVRDEDYDKPVLSPKFLKDYLDMMRIDGFEGAEGEQK